MQPESVEIKVTIAGTAVPDAIGKLDLADPKAWTIVFCEDVTTAAEATELLDLGVVLRARSKSATKGDSTVKFRPCRWSQLDRNFFSNGTFGDAELKIEADWAGTKHALAASMTAEWSDARLSAADLSVADLFTPDQLTFLTTCSQGRVNLAAVSALDPITATRWAKFQTTAAGRPLDIRAERWQLDDTLDFLELSIVSTTEEALDDQRALTTFVTDQALPPDTNQDSKTQRVLTHLIGNR
ncbi:hypothetical protein [Streptomyces sp. SID13031]|uniref:hypothetical protein n=1 Tax=Streptomyces sp. SID13031 TaxID=2706046 RepID=UPI0013CC7018|nr:hypothetical protein [Streptomyces sp. SID13031]NEA30699.1 hypothetical protein [Streptomyces sp. SID13031]